MWMTLSTIALVACNDKAPSDDTETVTDTATTDTTDTTDTGPTLDDTGTTDSEPDWDPRFDALAAALEADRVATGAPGLAAAVFQGGEVIFAAGFGERHPDGGEAVEATTLFRIGSVTKMLTAAGLLQQVDAGAVSLTDNLSEAMPDLEFALTPGHTDDFLVEHLISHQGGFYDYLVIDYGPEDELLEDVLMGLLADGLPLIAPPGEMWNYSNPNFYYAGLLHERLAGSYYREALQDDLFAPLGMDRTFFLGEEVLADGDYASGATTNWNTGVGAAVAGPDSYDNAWGRPAGYAWSSVLDLATFAQFLMDGDSAVLDDTLREAMSAPQVDVGYGIDLSYGYGLFTQPGIDLGGDWYDLTLVSHGGDIPGFAADVHFFPELDLGIAVLASADGAHVGPAMREVLALAELPEPGTPPEYTIDTDGYEDFAGDYVEPWNTGDFAVSVNKANEVLVSFPLLDDLGFSYVEELTPYTQDNFILTIDGYSLLITFIRDDEGAVGYARTRAFVGTRADEGGGGEAPPLSAAVDPSKFIEALPSASSADRQLTRFSKPWPE